MRKPRSAQREEKHCNNIHDEFRSNCALVQFNYHIHTYTVRKLASHVMHHIPSACMLMLAPTPQSIKHVNMYIPVHVQCIHVYAAQTEVWACGSACVHGRLGDGGGGGGEEGGQILQMPKRKHLFFHLQTYTMCIPLHI